MLERFVYHRPRAPEEVTNLLDELGERTRLHAGGTDLVVQIRAGVLHPEHVIDINGIQGLNDIEVLPDDGLRIGPGVTMSRLRSERRIQTRWPALAEGASEVGSRQIQNRATLVGNLCNASPAADTTPALFIYEANVNIQGPDGERSTPVGEFAVGPRRTRLGHGEWVTSIDLPAPPSPHGSAYVKLGRTSGVDLALVSVACLVSSQGTRLALASVGPTVIRALATEELLDASGSFSGEVADALAGEISPIDDVRASAEYRRTIASTLAKRAWERARYRSEEDDD